MFGMSSGAGEGDPTGKIFERGQMASASAVLLVLDGMLDVWLNGKSFAISKPCRIGYKIGVKCEKAKLTINSPTKGGHWRST